MKQLTTIFVLMMTTVLSFGQSFSSSNPDYITNVKLGEAALNGEDYDSCMVYYRKAFKIKQTSVLSTLRMAACAYSGGWGREYKDQMNKAIELDWGTAQGVFKNYEEFAYLQETPFAKTLDDEAMAAAKAQGVNFELMEELSEIGKLDQAQRREMSNYEWGTPAMDSLWRIQNYSDSVNTIRIIEIIEEYGYPGKSLVGRGQMGTAFLVIQHADLEVQEKYLPVLKEAANKEELRWSSVALLIDRVNLRQGNKQIYGSQVGRTDDGEHYVSPIDDPENVDKRRAEVGLGPLNDYCGNWDFTWDLERHLELWKELEAKKKEEEKKGEGK